MRLDTHHSRYRQFDVSCSSSQMVLLLLDSAIRYCREAVEHLSAGRWVEKGQAVDAALECLFELRRGLNLSQGDEVAIRLDQNYDFLCTKLSIGNSSRDADQFRQVAAALETIRNGWLELFARLRSEGRLQESDSSIDAAMLNT